jgi:hypothetical protein
MYVIGESLIKGNRGGPYKARYDEAKEVYATRHPDEVKCVCAGTGKTATGKNMFQVHGERSPYEAT